MTNTICPCFLVEETVEGVAVVEFAVSTILSQETVHEIAEQLSRLAEGPGPKDLLINFRDVQFMPGRMLAVLLLVARKVEWSGGSMRLCGIAPHLLRHFEVTRLYRYFEIFSDKTSALRSFSRRPYHPGPFDREPCGPAPLPTPGLAGCESVR